MSSTHMRKMYTPPLSQHQLPSKNPFYNRSFVQSDYVSQEQPPPPSEEQRTRSGSSIPWDKSDQTKKL